MESLEDSLSLSYAKRRREFGRPTSFRAPPPTMLWDLLPDEELRATWTPAEALSVGVQATKEISAHDVQTDTLRMEAASFAPPLLGSVGLPQPEAAAATVVVHRVPVATSEGRGDGGGVRGGIITLEDGGDIAGLGAAMGGGAGGAGAAGGAGGAAASAPSSASGAGSASTGGLSLSSSHSNRRILPATAAVHAARARARLERDEDYLRTVLRLAEAAQSGVSESAAFDAAEELGRDFSGLGSYRGNASRVRVVSASRAERWRAAASSGSGRGGGAVSAIDGAVADGGGFATVSAASLQAPVRALAWAADGSARLAVGVGPALFGSTEDARGGGHDARASTVGQRRVAARPIATQIGVNANGVAHHHGHHGGLPLGVTFDAARLDAPTAVLRASAPILALAFAPRQPTTVAAGDSLGRLTLHDVRMPASGAATGGGETGGTGGGSSHDSLLLPTSSMRAAEPSCAHPGGAVAVAWAASRAAGAEVAVAGADGRITWWDPRNLTAPLEDLDLGEALANGSGAQAGAAGGGSGASGAQGSGVAQGGPAGGKGKGAVDGAQLESVTGANAPSRSTHPPLTATCMEHAVAAGPGRFLVGTASGSILGIVRGAAPPRAGGGGRSKAHNGKRAAARAAAPRARVASEHRVVAVSAPGEGRNGGGGGNGSGPLEARLGGVSGGATAAGAGAAGEGIGAVNSAGNAGVRGSGHGPKPARSRGALPSASSGPIRAVAASASLPGCFFAISGASLRLWRDDLSAPLCRAPPGSAALTTLAASPARPGLAIVGDAAGGLAVWDMASSRARPAASAPAPRGAGAMTALSWSPAPELVAAGDELGGIALLRVDESLSRPAADTKDVLLAMLERDAAREKAAERGAVSSNKKGAGELAADGLEAGGRARYGDGFGDYADGDEETDREEQDGYARDLEAAKRVWEERRRGGGM